MKKIKKVINKPIPTHWHATLVAVFVASFMIIGYTATRSRPTIADTPVPQDYTSACSQAPPGYAFCFASYRTKIQGVTFQPGKPQTSQTGQPAEESCPDDVLTYNPEIGDCGAYDPATLQAAYNLTSYSANNGSGKTVALIDAYDDAAAETDLAAYRSEFNLPACTTANGCFEKVNQNGVEGSYPATNSGWDYEMSLDMDMVSAICPNCRILLVEANDSYVTDLLAAEQTAENLGANAISNSWGTSESGYTSETSLDSVFNNPNIFFAAASGDSGYDENWWPAASPYVTAVGGTSLYQAGGTTTRNATESAWSGSGSGCSYYEPKPAWQTDTGCSNRSIVDVSAVANPQTGVWVYDSTSGDWNIVGGTSAASPIIASISALTSNTTFTPATEYANAQDFNNVTTGSASNPNCTSGNYLCNAGTGYNGITGLGTPNGIAGFETTTSTDKPVIKITSPSPYTNELSGDFTVTGTTSDVAGTVESVAVSVDNGSFQPATGTTSWSITLNASNYSIGPHTITVKATNYVDNKSTATLGISTGDITPPTNPVLSDTSNLDNQVNLSWTASTASAGLAGYYLYRDSSSVPYATLGPSVTTYSDNSVVPDSLYTYYVVAFDVNGNTSQPSQTLSEYTPVVDTTTPPNSPTNVTAANITTNSVTLTWSPSTDSIPDTTVMGYYIYRNGVDVNQIAASQQNPSYIDESGITPNTTYEYQVSAYDQDNNFSALSAPIYVTTTDSASPTAPDAPTNLSADAVSSGQINLSWTASVSPYGVTDYTIIRDDVVLATVAGTSYADTQVSPDSTYSYYVYANLGTSLYSSASQLVEATSPNSPESPTLSYTNFSQQVYVHSASVPVDVTALANDGGSISSCSLSANSTPVGDAITTGPYDFSLNSLNFSNGTVNLSASCTDNQGHLNNTSISLIVNNGDLTNSGSVGLSDLAILASNWGKSGQTYDEGNITGQSTVNLSDLSVLATNWGWEAP